VKSKDSRCQLQLEEYNVNFSQHSNPKLFILWPTFRRMMKL